MESVPKYWSESLQALVYWIAYRKQFYNGHLLKEGAIVGELVHCLSAKIDSKQRIECEAMYKRLSPQILKQTQADIAIGSIDNNRDSDGKYMKLDTKTVQQVIEVKRFPCSNEKLINDFKKLKEFKKYNPKKRAFQILVGQKDISELVISDAGKVVSIPLREKLGIDYIKSRMAKKAFGTKKESEYGVFAALIEVT